MARSDAGHAGYVEISRGVSVSTSDGAITGPD